MSTSTLFSTLSVVVNCLVVVCVAFQYIALQWKHFEQIARSCIFLFFEYCCCCCCCCFARSMCCYRSVISSYILYIYRTLLRHRNLLLYIDFPLPSIIIIAQSLFFSFLVRISSEKLIFFSLFFVVAEISFLFLLFCSCCFTMVME